jgi:peptidyl-prolyl cis-trans isomerase C
VAGALVLAWGVGRALTQTGGGNVPPTAMQPKVAAVVNGEAVTMAELDWALRLAGPSPQQLPEAQQRHHREEALNFLIDQKLMEQFMSKNGPPLNPAEVDAKLAELEAGLKKQGKSMLEFYRDTNQNAEQLHKAIGHSLRWVHYIEQHVSDAELKKYYDEYKDFFDDTTVHAYHIVIRVRPGSPEAERTAARARLAELRRQILEKKIDFAQAARTHSQCISAAQGGDLNFIHRKFEVDDNFAKVAFSLPTDQVSDVVETEYGVHLIKVTERKQGPGSDFAKVKPKVSEVYAADLYLQIVNQQRKSARIERFVQ